MQATVFKNFEQQFPSIAANVEDAAIIERELYLVLNDGSHILYDDETKTIRNIPNDSRAMTEDECRNEFGTRLYKIMWKKGITQQELSDMTGIPRVTISYYITGRSTPSFYKVDKIAKALGCSADDFRYID